MTERNMTIIRPAACCQDGTIGSIMTTNYISIFRGQTVREAMRELVRQAGDHDNISTLYLVDEHQVLLGAMDLQDLIIARENTPLETIVHPCPRLRADARIDDCLEQLRDNPQEALPVVDQARRLCGVLPAAVVTQLVDELLGEDYAMLAGLSAQEDLQEPLKKSIRKRLPWLIVLLGLGLVVSAVVGLFEEVMASLTLVVCFQSLILDMSGNVGTQSLAVTIRVLSDEHLTGRQKLGLIWKEARVGLVNGLLLGALSFLCIGLYIMGVQHQSLLLAFSVSLCTGVALAVSMLLSSISGTAIPLVFEALHLDPAVASGPLITTVNDLVAVVTYYGLAWLLLLKALHLG